MKHFHDTYYAPDNAVIAISGDVVPEQVHQLVEKYFGDIPATPLPPHPDVSEPLNTKERFERQTDTHATAPALAIGWKMPGPESPDYYPLAVLGALLLDGDASLLYQRMVKERQTMLSISGGFGWPLGDPLTFAGPSLMVAFGIYKPGTSARQNVDDIQAVIDGIARDSLDPARLKAVHTKMVADFYKELARNRCPPWRAKRRRVVPGSREATRDTRRTEGAKGDPKGASERGVQSYGRPVCSRNELAMLWRNAG